MKERVKYRSSTKGHPQLVLDGFPFTRHRMRGVKIEWRCVQALALKCKARIRTEASGDRVDIIRTDHNHVILNERRKRGSLKKVFEQQRLAKKIVEKTNKESKRKVSRKYNVTSTMSSFGKF